MEGTRMKTYFWKTILHTSDEKQYEHFVPTNDMNIYSVIDSIFKMSKHGFFLIENYGTLTSTSKNEKNESVKKSGKFINLSDVISINVEFFNSYDDNLTQII